MTITLTPEQSMLYEEGGYASWRIEEDIVERLWRDNITGPVVVTLDDGSILFAVSQGVIA